MTCAKKLTENILSSCLDTPRKGVDGGKAVLINWDDIDFISSVVVGDLITDLKLNAGATGYALEWYKDLGSSDSALIPSTEDFDGFSHKLLARIATTTVNHAERSNEIKNGRFIVVYESKYKGINSEDAFKVRGWESGLLLSEMAENTLENSGSILFTLATQEGDVEKYPYHIFLETDYATSKATFDLLFYTMAISGLEALEEVWLPSSLVGNNLVGEKNGDLLAITDLDFVAGDYIPATSSATFSVPNTATYQNADASLNNHLGAADDFWFNGGVQSVSTSELVAVDFGNTFVWYDAAAPYHIRAIGVKKPIALTSQEENDFSNLFLLWLYYFGTLNDYGVLKENRESTSYSAEYQTVYDAMNNPPSSTVADRQDTVMIDLKAAGLLTILDVIQIYADENNNLLNWINPSIFNPTLLGTPNPTFTSLEGWLSDGINGCINSGFDPNDGTNYSQDSACMFAYIRNNVGEAGRDFGVNTGASLIELLSRHTDDKAYAWVNSATASSMANTDSRGMYVLNRTLSTHQDLYKNKVRIINATVTSIALEDYDHNAYVLGLNDLGSLSNPSTRQVSVFGAGAGLTQQNINDLTDIIETYMDANGKGVIT